MVPSTITPKSIAPSENRFAGIWVNCIRMNTVTSDIGIATAATKARTRTAQEQDKHNTDEADAFHHGAEDLLLGCVDQIVAIDIRGDAHVLRGELAC